MKTRAVLWVLSAVMLTAFAAIVSQNAMADGGENGIPPLVGKFSSTVQGSVAICLNPNTFAEESCSTSGTLVVPLSILQNGAGTSDNQGNSCETFTEVDSNLPVDASPPFVTPNEHTATKVLNYDSTTGTGDGTFISYSSGGTCNGAIFDSTGATEVSSGTFHFVETDGGRRSDSLTTKVTNSKDSIGDFSISGIALKQTRSEF